jgi:hypothetical protein
MSLAEPAWIKDGLRGVVTAGLGPPGPLRTLILRR